MAEQPNGSSIQDDAQLGQAAELELRERVTVLEEWAQRAASAQGLLAGGLIALALAGLLLVIANRKAMRG